MKLKFEKLLSGVKDVHLNRRTYADSLNEIKKAYENDPQALLDQSGLAAYLNPDSQNLAAENLILGAILIVTGIILAFMGRRMFKLFLSISGFLVGSSSIWYIIVLIETYTKKDIPQYGFWIACILGGILGAYVFNTAWKWGIYIMSAYGGIMLGIWVFGMIQDNTKEVYRTAFLVVSAIICGLAARYIDEFVVISTSSLMGAFTVFWGIDFMKPMGFRLFVKKTIDQSDLNLQDFINSMNKESICYCMIGVLFITVSGIYIQYRHQPRTYDFE